MASLHPRFSTHRALVVLLFGLMLAIGATACFFQIFSTFTPYDDEGYVMVSLQSFLDGHPLYDGVYTTFGPSYYLAKAAIYRLTGSEVSHDSFGVTTVVMWTMATLLCALFVYRLTGSMLLAAAAYLLTYRTLSLVSSEPGHPQEFCALILAAIVYLASFATSPARLRFVLPAIGVLIGILTLTKINLGMFAIVAMGGVVVSFASTEAVRRVLAWILVAVAALGPSCLMREHLDTDWVQNYAAVASLTGVGAMAVATLARRERVISLRLSAITCGAFMAAALAVFLITLACGTSVAGFWYGVIKNPLNFLGVAVGPALVSTFAVAAAVVACLSALGYCAHRSQRIKLSGWFAAAAPVALGAARLLFVIGVSSIIFFKHLPDGVLYLFEYACPWVWLAMAWPTGEAEPLESALSRTAIALLAALEMLQAFPVAGSQMSIATFLLAPAAAVCGWDFWRQLQATRWRLPRRVAIAGGAAAWLAIALGGGYFEWYYHGLYGDLLPLDLPGARWIRCPGTTVGALRCLSVNLQHDCDTFLSLPGFNSLNFWSQRKPPTGFNTTYWPLLLDEQQQQAIVDQLEQHPLACLVCCPSQLRLWLRGRELPDTCLVRYCKEQFRPVAQVGDFEYWTRKGRELPPMVAAAELQTLPADVASRLKDAELPPGVSPNAILRLRLAGVSDAPLTIRGIVVANFRTGEVMAHSHAGEVEYGIALLDSNMRCVPFPLYVDLSKGRDPGTLYLVPYRKWEGVHDFDYSKVVIGLLDAENIASIAIPVEISLR